MAGWFNEVALIAVLVGINAIFAASEIALISVRSHRMYELANRGSKAARAVIKLTEEPDRLLATIQIGITLAGFMASATAAVGLSTALASTLRTIPNSLVANSAQAIAVFLVTIAISYISLVIGELVPKRLALQHAETISLRIARPLDALATAASPFVRFLTVSTRLVMWLLGVKAEANRQQVTEEEILHMIASHEDIQPEEKEIISNVFAFSDAEAKDVMVPRYDVLAIAAATSCSEAVRLLVKADVEHVPVYQDTIDNPTGQVALNDVAGMLVIGQGDSPVSEVMEPIRIIPETKRVGELLIEMQENKDPIVVVADEHGVVVGVVSFDALVQDMVEGTETPEEMGVLLASGEYIIRGSLPIRDVNRMLETQIPDSDDYVTVAGYIIAQLGRIPVKGDFVKHGKVTLRVEEMIGNRTHKIRIQQGI